MLHDKFLISLEQVGILSNMVGTVIPMVIAMAVLLYYREEYFRYWTVSYALLSVGLILDLLSAHFGHPFAFCSVLALFHVVGTLYLFKVAFSLNQREPAWGWQVGVTAAVFGMIEVFMLQGQPFENAILPSLAGNLIAHLLLGWTLFRIQSSSKVRSWLAALSLGIGLWGLTYPVLVQAHVVWLGYLVIATLHLFIGVGMALFLFETNAQKLSAQNAELTRLDQLKNNFISTISHEFRTPLSAIKSATWFSFRADATQLQEINKIIGENVDRITSLLNDVLDYSRMESGVFTYDLRPVDLAAIAETSASRMQGALQERELEVVVEAPAADVVVEGDEDRLGQVVENLLSNACKFTPAGGRVTIAVGLEGEQAVLRVADTGIGIAADEHDRIFTKFYQVESSSKRKAGGTGLGLAIARSIVEDGHHGRLSVASTPGEGSVFTVQLPRRQGLTLSAPRGVASRGTGKLG